MPKVIISLEIQTEDRQETARVNQWFGSDEFRDFITKHVKSIYKGLNIKNDYSDLNYLSN